MSEKQDRFLRDNQSELIRLSHTFGSYPANITKSSIENYVCQFDDDDLQLGLKLLQNVNFYDPTRMMTLSKTLGETVHSINNSSFDNVIFCPMSTSSGDSSEGILRNLRMTMTGRNSPKLTNANHINVVTDLSEPQFTEDTENKKIILIDHFIGSGDTIIKTWGAIQQWKNENYDYYVGVLVGYDDAIHKIEDTFEELHILPIVTLHESHRIFRKSSHIFSESEKNILKGYCDKLNLPKNHRYGHNDGQSLVVFSNRISNNVLPILHYTTENWRPLFPRII